MSLWVDQVTWSHSLALTFTLMGDHLQYRPRTLDTLHYHQGLSERLKSLVCCKRTWICVFDGYFCRLLLETFPICCFMDLPGQAKKRV